MQIAAVNTEEDQDERLVEFTEGSPRETLSLGRMRRGKPLMFTSRNTYVVFLSVKSYLRLVPCMG